MASRDLKDADPALAAGFLKVKGIFDAVFTGYELKPTTTARDLAEQKAAFDAGRSRIDGIHSKSAHNYLPSRAIDYGIFRKNAHGMPSSYIDALLEAKKFDPVLHKAMYWCAAQLVQRFGFRSGNDWNNNALPVEPDPAESLNDPYHMELR